ncbi:MAG: hypothetical protein Q4C42_07395 [Clostridia bacterium]|nr:hypothetical protein [Clostridia bacterium]
MSDITDISRIWPEWHIVDSIGEGAYGKVYRAIRQDLGDTYDCAIKILSIPKNKEELERVKIEVESEEAAYDYFHGIVTE